MSGRDRGSITIWMLGLSLLLLLFGGLSLDYWRALALQRELAAAADSAAVAAASGIDEETYRDTGQIVLDAPRSRALADASVTWQGIDVVSSVVDVDVDATSVSVTLTAEVELGLLGVLVDQDEPLTVRATASAVPVLVP